VEGVAEVAPGDEGRVGGIRPPGLEQGLEGGDQVAFAPAAGLAFLTCGQEPAGGAGGEADADLDVPLPRPLGQLVGGRGHGGGQPVPDPAPCLGVAVAVADLGELARHRVGGAQPRQDPEQDLARLRHGGALGRGGGLPWDVRLSWVRDHIGEHPPDQELARLLVDLLQGGTDRLVEQHAAVHQILRVAEVGRARGGGPRPLPDLGPVGDPHEVRLERRRERGRAPGRGRQLIHQPAPTPVVADGVAAGREAEVERGVVVHLGDGRAHVVGERAGPALPQGAGEDQLDRTVAEVAGGAPGRVLVEHPVQRVADLGQEVVVAHQQRRRTTIAQRIAQQLLQAAVVAPQVAQQGEVPIAGEAEGQEGAVEPAGRRPRDHVDPGIGVHQVEHGTVGRLVPAAGHGQVVQLQGDTTDPDGQAHPSVEDHGQADVLAAEIVRHPRPPPSRARVEPRLWASR
jgi:hypothetical protein